MSQIQKRAKIYTILAFVLIDILALYSGIGILAAVLTIGLAIYGFFTFSRLVLRRSRLIWSLRNRLIVTYMFMGVVPIGLILALAYCGAWIVVGQIATFLVGTELNRRAAVLEDPVRILARSRPGDRDAILQQVAPLLARREPGFQVSIAGDAEYHYPPGSAFPAPANAWRDYVGTVYRDGTYYSMAIARSGERIAVIAAPLTSNVLENLVPGIGTLGFYERRQTNSASANSTGSAARIKTFIAGRVPPPNNALDFEYPWFNPMDLGIWDTPNSHRLVDLTVQTRPSAVLGVVFGDGLDTAQISLQIFVLIAFLLAIVEMISIVAGISMTRSITGAVNNLYEGTQRVARGDFSHRIPVKGNDQLASLGNSFNDMSAQLEKLVTVTKEKERLQSELAIASEVQNQLFPRGAPPTHTIQLTGSCEPARSVSGDYYDYLCLPNGNLALAIGDVAGKGISAALLMASIQSIMRTQLAQGSTYSTAGIVAQLNRQLYVNTTPEKYATFFFGIYDENNRMLTYTNAGHLAPLLICGGSVKPLEVTGTVVGLFPSMTYEERTVRICDGDLLIAYTDGITEPENAYGEEFGAERLAETILRYQSAEPREIVARTMESVKQWSSSPELPDDMTVLIAKGIA
ncbi:MAG: SpoIIE family protein phosphatase [Acidobacteriota bacterium]|nr:SpoIIE family protein phosphatase [Acidobacteriota bacterium]